MCGLVGALTWSKDGFRVDASYITRMRETVAHRGPDGAATWVSPDCTVGFGFRRLAIIDLSHLADQPMSNEDGTVWLVFNGEIYNHAEIRKELERIGGHVWRTDHSDTEMLVHAFEEWGIDFVHRLRGMFAIAIWDARARELWLIRDRLGVKPLYYAFHHDRVVFGSEIKALLADPQQERRVDEQAFFHFLSFLTTPAPTTLFAGIGKLPPATWMRIRADGQREQRTYWDVWDATDIHVPRSDDEIAEALLEQLRISVKLRKISDVPVGVFLSGGIDSSTNAMLFAEGGGDLRTFTIGYDRAYDSNPDETRYARSVAQMLHADHHERFLGPKDLVDFLPRMVELQDEPIADPVCVPVYYMSKMARDNGVIVGQVGEGADELFCGYPGWFKYLRLQSMNRWPVPRVAKQAGLAAMTAAGRDKSWAYEYLRRGAADVPVFWGGAEAFTQREKEALLSPRLRDRFRGTTSWDALSGYRRRFEERAADRSDLNWMTYLDLNVRLPELLLMRVDKMSMGTSLEARVPFLDHRFVEFAMRIPTDVKLRGGRPKAILKRAVRDLLPVELIERKKQGFGVPIHEWFGESLGPMVERDLRDFCRATDFLDPRAVESVRRSGRAAQTWYLLNFALWWKQFIA